MSAFCERREMEKIHVTRKKYLFIQIFRIKLILLKIGSSSDLPYLNSRLEVKLS